MSNMTAVEYLLDRYAKNSFLTVHVFKIAEQMEKQQIMDAYAQGVADEAKEILDVTKDSEEYYARKYSNIGSIDKKFLISIDRYSIVYDGVETFLPKKLVELADYLYSNSGKFVTRESILDNVWPKVCVLDRTIDVHISKLKKLYPEMPIKTHKGVGYGWIPED